MSRQTGLHNINETYLKIVQNPRSEEYRVANIIRTMDGQIGVDIYLKTGEKPHKWDPRLGVSIEEIVTGTGINRTRVLEILQILKGSDVGMIWQLPNGKYATV